MVLLKYGLRVKRSFVGEQWVWKESRIWNENHPKKILPLFWLEVRWMSGQWVWRALNSEDDTRGKGSVLTHGWRAFQVKIVCTFEIPISFCLSFLIKVHQKRWWSQ